MILDDIIAYKKKKIWDEKQLTSMNKIYAQIENCNESRDFKKALDKEGISIIAEIKKASPSKGIIKKDFDPILIAKAYTQNRADIISVLTEDHFFEGHNYFLKLVRDVTSAPLLRKDFIIDPYQVYQSKALGADAILLITAVLSKKELIQLKEIAEGLQLSCLVEVHDRSQLEMALEADSDIIGINNRDLKTFKTCLTHTENLVKHIPKSKLVVSESGINTRSDIQYLHDLGVKGVLIGESLMRSDSIDNKFKELRGELN
ncbi:MAG: indole-3-glycerol phosphate synthase TrpC [Clostridia bacterium]|nr:indole-3-glycerol phosphate synthase TrpC [Clostridia bacterium]